MNFVGPIEGMNFSPVAEYNNYLKGSASFEVNSDLSFETILDRQKDTLRQKNVVQKSQDAVNSDFENVLSSSRIKQNSAANFLNSFGNALGGGLNSVDQSTKTFERAQEAMAMGENVSVHDVMIAAEKANLSMQMAIQLRNKIITAYNEINNVKV
ncbi:MAG TPA: flagellar hook-basal body complex protein FliE [Candidatus Gastranaerophilaceae bacterium]|nr:flagellar hook-basal body complex protein FliE [Candidatus Gastranaerophilaceae bacterium]HPT41340.1 flagellar hook-basal body complex protein FliE [Candidatus Gastranaerophilaceae bacterium]